MESGREDFPFFKGLTLKPLLSRSFSLKDAEGIHSSAKLTTRHVVELTKLLHLQDQT